MWSCHIVVYHGCLSLYLLDMILCLCLYTSFVSFIIWTCDHSVHMFICYCFIVLIYEFITRCVLEISLYQRLFYHKPSNRKDWNIIDSNWNLVIRNIMISMYFEGIMKVRWHMIFIFIILWRRIMESNLIHLETLDVFLVHNSDPAIR